MNFIEKKKIIVSGRRPVRHPARGHATARRFGGLTAMPNPHKRGISIMSSEIYINHIVS